MARIALSSKGDLSQNLAIKGNLANSRARCFNCDQFAQLVVHFMNNHAEVNGIGALRIKLNYP